MRAEQEPDPRGLIWLDLFRADSKSSRSPPNWKSLDVQKGSGQCHTSAVNKMHLKKHGEATSFVNKNIDNQLHEAKWVEGEWSYWK